jgi:hypothetical protein
MRPSRKFTSLPLILYEECGQLSDHKADITSLFLRRYGGIITLEE